jgi:transcriptional regulator with XRE-family HTH domain
MPRTSTSAIASAVAGHAVRDARRAVGMTQAELAGRLGTSAPYVSLIETGRANPTIGQLSAVATALGVEMDLQFRVPEPLIEPTIPKPPDLQVA